MYEFHEDVKTMLLINGNDTCDENYVFPSNPVLFRYGQYYFDDGTQAPYRIEATEQNPDYESSTSQIEKYLVNICPLHVRMCFFKKTAFRK